ncbi:MAG TPA: hypothetical protein PLS28_04790 [Clostridiales bacterium]|nr:hypothetical protein [Clostridiales bacterium]
MYREFDFFQHVARTENCSELCTAFRKTIQKILLADSPVHADPVSCGLAASCIAYAYLDWLAGSYGDAALDEVLAVTEEFLRESVPCLKCQGDVSP